MSNLRDRVKSKPTLPTEDIEVEQWGEVVRIRGLTAAQVAEIADAEEGEDDDKAVEGLVWSIRNLLLPCVLDPETNEPAFGEDDVDWLKEQGSVVIQKLSTKVQELSGMRALDEAKKG